MKQISKNKVKEINWPTSMYFTIGKLVDLNPKMLTPSKLDITIRVRLTKEIEAGKIAEIGFIPGSQGRPKKVFAFTPVTKIVLEKAWADGIQPAENIDKLLNVINVTSPIKPTIINPASVPASVPVTAEN